MWYKITISNRRNFNPLTFFWSSRKNNYDDYWNKKSYKRINLRLF